MKIQCFRLLVVLGLIALGVLMPDGAAATPNATFVVNSYFDSNDGACNAAICTLREAIHAANASAGLDTINFNIAGCPCNIFVVTTLPEITDPVIINGYSQPGATANTFNTANNAVLKIQLSGWFAPPGTNGLGISGGGSTVKGLSIILFSGSGIWLKTKGANTIEGNWLGISPTGDSALGNGRGILVSHLSSLNALGGALAAQHNLISGNTNEGIRLDISGGSADRNSVVGNIIGQDKSNMNAVPNGLGILILSKRNAIGQGGLGGSNHVVGNSAVGIEIRGNGAVKNIIGNNAITENGTYGIWIHNGASKNKIGPSIGNFIAQNDPAGISIADETSRRNTVRGNNIQLNGGLGIDLGADGVTLNDAGDADGGPNLRQNFPVIKLAESATDRVKGKLKAAPNVQYTIDFYFANACDSIGYGEGFFVGSPGVTTAANGVAKFDAIGAVNIPFGSLIIATATDAKGNTSEYSK